MGNGPVRRAQPLTSALATILIGGARAVYRELREVVSVNPPTDHQDVPRGKSGAPLWPRRGIGLAPGGAVSGDTLESRCPAGPGIPTWRQGRGQGGVRATHLPAMAPDTCARVLRRWTSSTPVPRRPASDPSSSSRPQSCERTAQGIAGRRRAPRKRGLLLAKCLGAAGTERSIAGRMGKARTEGRTAGPSKWYNVVESLGWALRTPLPRYEERDGCKRGSAEPAGPAV